MPIETVIFDMDGVLVDSEIYWEEARQEYARDVGKVWTIDDQYKVMGRKTLTWAQIMQEVLQLDTPIETIASDMIARMKVKYEENLPVRPGAIEAVKMAGQHFRVGLASGSPTELIKYVTQLTELDQIFEVMVFGDDIEHGKPAPDIYIEALRQLGMPADTALGVEDSANGIRSLHAAGMVAIAAPSPGFTLPDDVLALSAAKIDSLEEFSLSLIRTIETRV